MTKKKQKTFSMEVAAHVDTNEEKDDGFWYVVFDTEDMRDTTNFFDNEKEAQEYVHKLIIDDMRPSAYVMVIKGHELPLMAGFVND